MNNFHGCNKTKSFFEGWYFKNQGKTETLSIIPAFHIDEKGSDYASIQIITGEKSYYIEYPSKDFYAPRKRQLDIRGQNKLSGCFCKIGKNIFTDHGIYIDIANKDISLIGIIAYDKFHTIKYDIMGVFGLLPFLQCYHGVISMMHRLSGVLVLNGKKIDFNGGVGYIEKDWGSSFPKRYLWSQCSNGSTSIMLSAADIPVFGDQCSSRSKNTRNLSFNGLICVIYYAGCEYRYATYNGSKILKWSENEAVIIRGRDKLIVRLVDDNASVASTGHNNAHNNIHKSEHNNVHNNERNNVSGSGLNKDSAKNNNSFELKAPVNGGMNRKILESVSCKVYYKWIRNGRVIFEFISNNAAFESCFD